MEYIITDRFNLKDTLESGQFFRFKLEDGWYYIQHKESVFKLKQEKNNIFYSGIDKSFLINFLGLYHNMDEIFPVFDENIRSCMKKYYGIRIMGQDPWECTLSFSLSSASNISRIKKNLDSLAKRFGKRIIFDKKEFFTLPAPPDIKDEIEVRKCGVGFRAKYLTKLSGIDERFFYNLRDMDYYPAKDKLVELPGIGDKIADCILLFAFGHLNAFPVDVWIKRIMQSIYFRGKDIKKEEIVRFAQRKFYPYAGYAQQFLYHSARTGKIR